MTTIVSAFITNVNSREDRSIIQYLEYGKLLLQSKNNKIIFLDKIMYDIIENQDYNRENTKLVLYEKEYSYLYDYLNSLNNFNLTTDNKSKDTLEFIFTMCNKTEWIKEAIRLNSFNTDNFVWVDFGIRHISKSDDIEFINRLDNLNKPYDKIRIGSIWNLNIHYNVNIYKNITWYFAGGIFGGNKDSLLKFAELMREKCEFIMNKYKLLIWEVNIWYIIYMENPYLFSPYDCDHNNSLIDNY